MKVLPRLSIAAVLLAASLLPAIAQTPPPQTPPHQKHGQKTAPPAAPPTPPAEEKPSPYRPYKEVVTKDAVTQTGLFKVHRIEDRILFEIPNDKLGRALLWQTEVAQVGASAPGYPGANTGAKIIRFTRRGARVFLRAVDYGVRSAVDGATRVGVDENTVEPILMTFEIQAEGDGGAPVIDVTQLFTSDPPDFSAREATGGIAVDPTRSYIDRIKSFPANIETRSVLTYMVGMGMASPFAPAVAPGPSATTAVVNYSLDLLPETPMQGRLADSRIGFSAQEFTEYGRPENRAVVRQYINRFRLEKKDPSAALSEPIQPITVYLSREVPEKWRPYLKQGVEAWLPAFEQAGFKNAIRCIDAPTNAQDPDWDPEDARYTVIRWAPSQTQNAMGPSIQDPRSGETLSGHIIVWNDVLQLAEDWYFSQCAAVDHDAQKLPLPDDLEGRLLTFIITHEVGHTLGLEHNFKASSAYSVAQLRDHAFVEKNGLSASVMDYARFNYVAQPGDGAKTIGCLGPYDKFAIQYGYMPIPSAKTPDEEKPALNALLSKQVGRPELGFGGEEYLGLDPASQTEDLSNDSLLASQLGLDNIDRIARDVLIPATTKPGEDYAMLTEMYIALMQQRFVEMTHVLSLIGGVEANDFHQGAQGAVFHPVDADRQARAVKFLADRAFVKCDALALRDVLVKVAPVGDLDMVTSEARAFLTLMLSEPRLRRIAANEAEYGQSAYGMSAFAKDLDDGVWKELGEKSPTVDPYRRALQRAYLKAIDGKINGGSASQTDFRFLARANLQSTAKRIDAALLRSHDQLTVLHLQQCRSDIESIVLNKFASPSAGGAPSLLDMLFGIDGKKPIGLMKDAGCFSTRSRLPDWLVQELK